VCALLIALEFSKKQANNWGYRPGVLDLFASTSTTVVLLSSSEPRHEMSTRTSKVHKYVIEHYPMSKEHCGARKHQVENPRFRP
jgi:hypothetical protein